MQGFKNSRSSVEVPELDLPEYLPSVWSSFRPARQHRYVGYRPTSRLRIDPGSHQQAKTLTDAREHGKAELRSTLRIQPLREVPNQGEEFTRELDFLTSAARGMRKRKTAARSDARYVPQSQFSLKKRSFVVRDYLERSEMIS